MALEGLTRLAARASAFVTAITGRGASTSAPAASPPEAAARSVCPRDRCPEALQRVDPLLVLRQAVEAVSAQARAADICLLAPGPASGFALDTRPAILSAILDALLAHAVGGARPGGAVLAELRQTADGLVFRIHDAGPGLPPEALRRLFQPAEGGLARAWTLGRALGGRLSAAATPGEGCTLSLWLPAAPGADRCASALPPPSPRLESAVLLLVDPDPVFAALLRQVVAALGAALHVSPDGEEGLALARDLRPDLILIEPDLPGLDGLALKAALDADPLTRGLPVAGLSRDPAPALARRGRLAGFDGWLTKPLDIPLFARTVTRLVQERAARDVDAAWRLHGVGPARQAPPV